MLYLCLGGALAALEARLLMASDDNSHSPLLDAPISNRDDGGGERAAIGQGVQGRITSSSGHAVSGALIRAKSTDSKARSIPDIAILSDKDGKYAWPLQPGKYDLSVAVEGREPLTKTVEVLSDQITELDFVLGD